MTTKTLEWLYTGLGTSLVMLWGTVWIACWLNIPSAVQEIVAEYMPLLIILTMFLLLDMSVIGIIGFLMCGTEPLKRQKVRT